MIYDEGRVGRVFVLRLEDGDRLPDAIETFAKDKSIRAAACWMVGGLGAGKLVVGPEDRDARPLKVLTAEIADPREVAAVGTLFEDEHGDPRLHMHAATGRGETTLTGCVRPGVDVWLVGEVVIMEVVGMDMLRKVEAASGLNLLSKAHH
ncbi:MAG: PPC domain-containing DNA-binding protein [Desulfovibrionaceae bacterium]